jgi:hypothetical protein
MGGSVCRGILEQGEFAHHDFLAEGSELFNVLIIILLLLLMLLLLLLLLRSSRARTVLPE